MLCRYGFYFQVASQVKSIAEGRFEKSHNLDRKNYSHATHAGTYRKPSTIFSEQVNCTLPVAMGGNTFGLQLKQEAGAETKCACSF